jgi:hypothetical protein
MPQKRSLAVEPRPYGRWAVQTAGSERATSLHETKADAIARAREVAKHRHAELVIKNKDGTIAQRDSYAATRYRQGTGSGSVE